MQMNKVGKKVVILGAGNVGATIAYTLTIEGMASEIVLIDINHDKAKGEAMDIIQGTAFCPPVNIYAGDYEHAAGADIVIVTLGMARKPGQTRLDLAQTNVNIIKDIIPRITAVAPDAVYVVVSNPVDVLTYAIVKLSGLPEERIIGSGTILDTARLRAGLAEHVNLNPQNVHAYVFGEHGDSSVIPWSLTTIGGLAMVDYCTHLCEQHNRCGKVELADIEHDMRTSGAKVIGYKGATYYAIALSVRRIVDCVLRDTNSILTISSMMHGEYGIEDVCMSIPCIINAHGIKHTIAPPLTADEKTKLIASADTLKEIIASLEI